MFICDQLDRTVWVLFRFGFSEWRGVVVRARMRKVVERSLDTHSSSVIGMVFVCVFGVVSTAGGDVVYFG